MKLTGRVRIGFACMALALAGTAYAQDAASTVAVPSTLAEAQGKFVLALDTGFLPPALREMMIEAMLQRREADVPEAAIRDFRAVLVHLRDRDTNTLQVALSFATPEAAETVAGLARAQREQMLADAQGAPPELVAAVQTMNIHTVGSNVLITPAAADSEGAAQLHRAVQGLNKSFTLALDMTALPPIPELNMAMMAAGAAQVSLLRIDETAINAAFRFGDEPTAQMMAQQMEMGRQHVLQNGVPGAPAGLAALIGQAQVKTEGGDILVTIPVAGSRLLDLIAQSMPAMGAAPAGSGRSYYYDLDNGEITASEVARDDRSVKAVIFGCGSCEKSAQFVGWIERITGTTAELAAVPQSGQPPRWVSITSDEGLQVMGAVDGKCAEGIIAELCEPQ